MANDPVLIDRLRDIAPMDAVEKNVFGARCWVMEGHMAFGVHDDDMLVRLGADATDTDALTPFDPMGKGKPMAGWFLVEQELLAEEDELRHWMERAMDHVAMLPPK